MKNTSALSSAGGFTFPELLVTLTIIATLALSGIGSWQGIAGRNHSRSNINKLIHAFYDARSQALISGSEVVLCPTSNGQSCQTGAGWQIGWMAFRNADGDSPPHPDANETVLHIAGPATGLQIEANRSAFVIRPFGLRSTNGTLTFCSRNRETPPRALIVSYTGKPRSSSTYASGGSLLCT